MKPPAKVIKHIKCVPSRGDGEPVSGERKPCPLSHTAMAWALWLKLRILFSGLAVEPVMLMDGLAYSVMIVFVENLQMDKICLVNLNLTSEVCNNISNYEKEHIEMQKYFSVYGMYNGIIMAFIPLFFILFMGAWSDKYGRKVPLYIATMGHLCYAFGYLLNSWVTKWPVEYLYVAALMDSLGGGTVSFLTAANAYISDVTSEETRTMRVGLANSIWYLGGPIGTLMGTYIYKYGGYQILFGTSLMMHIISLTYLFFLPESHGPFAKHKAKKEKHTEQITNEQPQAIQQAVSVSVKRPNQLRDTPNKISVWKMVADFFNYERIVDSFRCTFKPRGGLVRVFILLLILCNLLRRLGRGAYMYLFTRKVLGWRETNYGLWVTYKNLLAATGSLVAVPLLSRVLGMSDNYLAVLGALSSVVDYTLYGLVSKEAEFLIWIAPVAALLVNSCVIAIRSILSKFVTGDELGKVSAVMGALDGVMPMLSFSLYTAIYHAYVHVFPGAQFFFGASANLLMTFIFIFIICYTTSKSYGVKDLTTGEGKGSVKPTSLRFTNEGLSFHHHKHLLSGEDKDQRSATATSIATLTPYLCPSPEPELTSITDLDLSNVGTQQTTLVLSGVNFHLGTPKTKNRKNKDLVQTKKSNDIFVVSQMTGLEKRRIQEELSNPQKYSFKKPSSKENKNSDDKEGIDNLAFTNTEEENSKCIQNDDVADSLVLNQNNLINTDERNTDTAP